MCSLLAFTLKLLEHVVSAYGSISAASRSQRLGFRRNNGLLAANSLSRGVRAVSSFFNFRAYFWVIIRHSDIKYYQLKFGNQYSDWVLIFALFMGTSGGKCFNLRRTCFHCFAHARPLPGIFARNSHICTCACCTSISEGKQTD